MHLLVAWLFSLCLLSGTANAGSAEIGAEVAFEFRGFLESPAYPDQLSGLQSSIALVPETQWEDDDRNNQLRIVAFARYDAEDSDRSHSDLREAYWRYIGQGWELLVGLNKVFWGVAESRHLVNVINQVDAVEDADEEDYLGQPMIQLARDTNVGRFEAFFMAGFRERTFSGRTGRLRAPLPVDTDNARYKSGAKEWRSEFALRYSHYFGDVDVGLHVFSGTGREPRLVFDSAENSLIPVYEPITQFGVDVQVTRDAWLWKFEGLVREGQGSTFGAAIAGLEYTSFQIVNTDADLGVIVEGLYDGRSGDVFPTTFDQDVFVGTRLALNDVQDTSILAGIAVDIDEGLSSMRIEGYRRLGTSSRIDLEAQFFYEDDPAQPASFFLRDDFVSFTFSRFF